MTDETPGFDVGEMLLDGAIGVACGLISGPGASSIAGGSGGQSQMINLGTGTVKRTWNALTHHGLAAYGSEAAKAAAYYLSSTIKITESMFGKRSAISQGVNIAYNIIKVLVQ